MYSISSGIDRLPSPRMIAATFWAFARYALSGMLKYAQIGLTWEIVVILVVVPTRSPICEFDMPAMPSIGEYTLHHSRFNWAFTIWAFAASNCAWFAARVD